MSTIANVIINTRDGRSFHINEKEVRLTKGQPNMKPHEVHLIHGILAIAYGIEEAADEFEDEEDDDDEVNEFKGE